MEEMDTVDDMVEAGKGVVHDAIERYNNPVVLWTGGKDSTLVLWIVKQAVEEEGDELADVFDVLFIDHGQHFDEVHEFVDAVSEAWEFDVEVARNDDVIEKADEPYDDIEVEALNERNRREIERLEFDDDAFPYLMDTEVCNHLLKTVALNEVIEDKGYDAVVTGIRWDEQEARSDEDYFSPREDPDHDRVHPILHFTERDVWDSILDNEIPVNPLYEEGYRSLGSKVSTEKTTDVPAWEQDVEETTERAGRAQDKEGIMERLRDLGYM